MAYALGSSLLLLLLGLVHARLLVDNFGTAGHDGLHRSSAMLF